MAYTKLNSSTAKVMIENFNSFAKEYEKADKKKQKELKKELDLKGKKIQAVLDKDIAQYHKNAQERYTNIDNRLTRAIQLVKDAEKGAKAFEKSKKFDDLMPVNVAPTAIARLFQEESADDKAYSDAQFAYRGNPGNLDYIDKILGGKPAKNYRKVRQATIDNGKKHIQPKLQKMTEQQKLAEQLIKQCELMSKSAGEQLSTAKTDLKDLIDELKNELMNEADRKSIAYRVKQAASNANSVVTQLDSMRKAGTLTSSTYQAIESLSSAILDHIKSAKAIADTLKKRIAVVIKSVPKSAQSDKEVATALKQLPQFVKAIDAKIKAMPDDYKRAASALKAAQKEIA